MCIDADEMDGLAMAELHVNRSTEAVARVQHRWGPHLTDSNTLYVRRRLDSDTIRLGGNPGKLDIHMSLSEARELAEAIIAVCEWKEEPGDGR